LLSSRLGQAIAHPQNVLQASKYLVVGASGYLLNLAVFTFGVAVIGVHHLVAAVLAFIVAIVNNFWWNRRWTFDAHDGHLGSQGVRFFLICTAGFLLAAGLLELLVSVFGVERIIAQALSVAVIAPLTFLGNKLWSFRARVAHA
jgi:dolichol-phosphate mannosyltransferase